ncbi:hypothetical protein [Paenibacillus terrae]|uniref:Uncharacterized protein n=1 Tax=Paenibacillus terrae TaxID=159743 RepID=A0A0D7WWB5_9BACL|nr:hypothetical protein [Paenibacillus terrae]KJD43023.1 hypothetical protein QD47_25000 [Paenibacillus terrae]
MIPLRYREMLPQHMYEIDMAERHFCVMELVVDDREKSIDDLENQFVLKTATWQKAKAIIRSTFYSRAAQSYRTTGT